VRVASAMFTSLELTVVVVPLTVRLPEIMASLNVTFESVSTACPIATVPSVILTPVPPEK
jgi:hypothetical protein